MRARDDALARAIGVTRVARVTGLDRAGVEVACAVRPGGHVLQVSNGKGATFAAARASALAEAAELFCAERVDARALVYASLRELQIDARENVVSPAELPLSAPALWHDELRIAWLRARDLIDGRALFVPAQAVLCPPRGAPPLGPAICRWTSNGMGAHAHRERALLHALLEACERDQLARALPQGFTPRAIEERLLDVRTLDAKLRARVASIEARGFDVHLFDLTPSGRGALGLPVAGALLGDREGGPVPLTAGYACRADGAAALEAALFEAAQSRLTDVHGAREDTHAAQSDAQFAQEVAQARELLECCASIAPGRASSGFPRVGSRLRDVLAALRRAQIERIAAVDLAPVGFPLHVCKVLVPGFRLSELL